MTDAPDSPLTAFDTAALRERRSVKWRNYAPDVLPVWVAEMDTPLAGPVASALTAAVGRGDTGYASPGRLPEAFAGFAGRRWDWHPDPGAIRLASDVMSGIVETLHVLTEPGDRVVVNTPAYPPFFYWIERIGREVVDSPLAYGDDGYRLDLDRLERDFASGAKVFLLCSPHNPTGLVFSTAELLAVAELAERYDVRLVVDEIHAPLTYSDARHTPFASLDAPAAARSIAMASASKAWNLAGLKAALVVPGPEAAADVAAIPKPISEGVGLFGIIAAEAAFSEGEPWLADLLTGLEANRDHLGDLLTAQLPDIRYYAPRGTYLAWLDCRGLGLDDPADTFLRQGAVALAGGSVFGTSGQGFARFNFATAPDRVTEAVRRMAGALDRRL